MDFESFRTIIHMASFGLLALHMATANQAGNAILAHEYSRVSL
jgi:hypothetical protein